MTKYVSKILYTVVNYLAALNYYESILLYLYTVYIHYNIHKSINSTRNSDEKIKK